MWRKRALFVLLLATTGGCLEADADQLTKARAAALTLPAARGEIAAQDWPAAIAALRPRSLNVEKWGVSIVTREGMDGGWGYDVPRHGAEALPMPRSCYREAAPGVFAHGPC